MKRYLLGFLVVLIAACTMRSQLQTKPLKEVKKAIEITKPLKGRFNLISPLSYQAYIPKVEKFFTLILNDASVLEVKFIGTTQDPSNILATIRASEDFTAKVTTYRPLYWKSKAVAGTIDMEIKLNVYRLNRPGCSIVNTLTHEYMHVLKYSHGPNDVTGEARDRSVPYWFGAKAEEYCLKGII